MMSFQKNITQFAKTSAETSKNNLLVTLHAMKNIYKLK